MPQNKVLIILADKSEQTDQRSQLLTNFCRTFAEKCQTNGASVDLLDLTADLEFEPFKNEKSSKILEYQIRIKNAQLLVFFHSTPWQTVPAILKAFLDQTLTSGFAYRNYKKLTQGLLTDKEALIFATSEIAGWKLSGLYGSILRNFWQKSICGTCGLKNELYLFSPLRAAKDEEVEKWKQKLLQVADKHTKPRPSLLANLDL